MAKFPAPTNGYLSVNGRKYMGLFNSWDGNNYTMWMCPHDCGCAVTDARKHEKWHQQFEKRDKDARTK